MLSNGEVKTVYMIRRKSDGFFSSGGGSPIFRKTGKVWSTKGHLKLHLNMLIGITSEYQRGYGWSEGEFIKPYTVAISGTYDGCEIVELEQIITTKTSEINLNDLLTQRAAIELKNHNLRHNTYVIQDLRAK